MLTEKVMRTVGSSTEMVGRGSGLSRFADGLSDGDVRQARDRADVSGLMGFWLRKRGKQKRK